MIKELIETFRKPTPSVIAERELEEARRQLLLAHTGVEYAQSQVAYQQMRIRRLERTVGELRQVERAQTPLLEFGA